MYSVHPSQVLCSIRKTLLFNLLIFYLIKTECFHLRVMLTAARGPTSFEDLKTVNGILHPTFVEACKAAGLVEDDAEWKNCLQEASLFCGPGAMRRLFAVILTQNNPQNPWLLWNDFRYPFSISKIHQTSYESGLGNTCRKIFCLTKDAAEMIRCTGSTNTSSTKRFSSLKICASYTTEKRWLKWVYLLPCVPFA